MTTDDSPPEWPVPAGCCGGCRLPSPVQSASQAVPCSQTSGCSWPVRVLMCESDSGQNERESESGKR